MENSGDVVAVADGVAVVRGEVEVEGDPSRPLATWRPLRPAWSRYATDEACQPGVDPTAQVW